MMRAGLACAVAVLLLSACDPDPTAGGFAFRIVNDTANPVTVSYCGNASCSKTDWTETVNPGAVLPANTAAEGFDEWYRFRLAATGGLLGCRTVRFSKVQKDFVLPVSSATPCTGR